MTKPALSLDGIRVIDLSRVIAGPWCGALLADLGADVIKVEDTGPGDESRTWPPHKDGEAAAYLLFNRNKRGIALDLKTAGGGGGGQAAREGRGRGHRELPHRDHGVVRPRLRRAGRDQSTAHLLLGLRVRAHRAAQGQPRLRGADAGLQRHHVHHRRAGRPAGAGGRVLPRPDHRHPLRARRVQRDHPAREDRASASGWTARSSRPR